MQPESVAARVWPGRAFELEPLEGGITNQNFKALVDGNAYVLRVGGKDTKLLGIDRRAEHAAALGAAAAGAAPEVVAFVDDIGALVTRFVEGQALSSEEVRTPETIALLAATLKSVHDGRPMPIGFDSFAVVAAYAGTAFARGVQIPAAYEAASEVAVRIERLRGPQPLRPCHNDLLSANLIFDGAQVWIIDWEYAGMGDVFFDLANFSANNELGPDEDDELLRAYFGASSDAAAAALTAMKFMSDFREAMWGVVQQGISELDFDFVDYANRHFDRLARTAAAPRFRAALHTLGETG